MSSPFFCSGIVGQEERANTPERRLPRGNLTLKNLPKNGAQLDTLPLTVSASAVSTEGT